MVIKTTSTARNRTIKFVICTERTENHDNCENRENTVNRETRENQVNLIELNSSEEQDSRENNKVVNPNQETTTSLRLRDDSTDDRRDRINK